MAKVTATRLKGPDGQILSRQNLAVSSVPPRASVALPDPPTITEMTRNFAGAMLRWAGSGFATVDEVAFRLRLAQCRACPHWDEAARAGAGKCNHPKCGCTKAKLWLASERCPLGRW